MSIVLILLGAILVTTIAAANTGPLFTTTWTVSASVTSDRSLQTTIQVGFSYPIPARPNLRPTSLVLQPLQPLGTSTVKFNCNGGVQNQLTSIFTLSFETAPFGITCSFQTPLKRIPLSLKIITTDPNVGSIYNFPGISPITEKIQPLIQIRADALGSPHPISLSSRIIAQDDDFPQALLDAVYFFYIPVNSNFGAMKRYADPKLHLYDTSKMSLHAWTPDMGFYTDHDMFLGSLSIYPFFDLEKDVTSIPWLQSPILKDDTVHISPMDSVNQNGLHHLTVVYNLNIARGASGESLATSLSPMMISFPRTAIYDYFEGPNCFYTARSLESSVPDSSHPISNTIISTNQYPINFQCTFGITSANLADLQDDQDLFGINTSPTSNQFAALLTLFPLGDTTQPPQFVVLGNRYTQSHWKDLITGNDPTGTDPDTTPDVNFQADPSPIPNGLSIGYLTVKQMALFSAALPSNPNGSMFLEYEWEHFFGDEGVEIGARQLVYQADSADLWGSCSTTEIQPGNSNAIPVFTGSGTSLMAVSIAAATTGQAPLTRVRIVCTLYRSVSSGGNFTRPSNIQGSKYQPSITVKSAGLPPLEGMVDILYPKFIPTPFPILAYDSSPKDTLDRTNLGLPVLDWDTDITVGLYSRLDLITDEVNFTNDPLRHKLYQDLITLPYTARTFVLTIDDIGQCGTISQTSQTFFSSSTNTKISIKPSTLPVVNDQVRLCTLKVTVAFSDTPSKSISFEQLMPFWKSPQFSSPDDFQPLIGLTVNNLPTTYQFSHNQHPSNPNPTTLVLSQQSLVKLHVCYYKAITSASSIKLSLLAYTTSPTASPTDEPTSTEVFLNPNLPLPKIRDGLYRYCYYGGWFKPIHQQNLSSFGNFLHFGLKFTTIAQNSSESNSIVYSPKFLFQSSLSTLLHTVEVRTSRDLIPYQPPSGPSVLVINPNSNIITVSFSVSAEIAFSSLKSPRISVQIPSWLEIDISDSDIHICTIVPEDHPTKKASLSIFSKTQSRTNPDISTAIFSISQFLPLDTQATCTCSIGVTYNSVSVPSAVNPSLPIPLAPITVSSQDVAAQNVVYSSTLTPSNNNMVFLYHKTPKLFCPTDTNLYAPCIYQDQPVTTPPPSTTTPPPIITKLPVTTRGLSGLCDIVLTNRDIVEIYDDTKHKNMCSIPIAGMVTSRTISRTELNDSLSPGALALLPPGQVDFTLCDCQCKGYWHDDVMNLDQKKCSKCSVPECPNLFTPNNECTACECITEQCKRFRTYIFSTVYLTPQVLRHVVESEGETDQILYKSDQLSDIELSKYLSSPDQSTKSLYFSIMSSFSQYLTDYIKTRAIDDLFTTSTLESITMTPLVEGSFTVWKLTFSIINNSQQPISSLAPLYGLPTLQSTIGQLFSSFHNNEHLNLDPTNDPPQSQLGLAITTPILSTEYSSSLKLFTSDAIRTGCLSREDAIKLKTTNAPATADMLHQCPLPNQYTPIHNDLAKTDSFNPLWSACSTSSSPSMEFTQYESLLQPTVSTISLSIRQIFPRCLDFAGVDVGMLHVPCQIDSKSIVYSTTSSALLLPIYTQTLLSSFSTDTLDLPIQQRISQLRQTIFPKFPSFPQLTIVTCPIVEVLPPGTKPKKPKKNSIPESDRCPVGTYGDKCQLENTVEQTSMFMSPTNLSTQSHSHIQWEYKGDNTQELTLVLQSNTKTNTGSGYFAWSQLLGTVPAASLYASAQIPTIDQSKLFQHVYDSIADGNTDMTDIYDQSTQVIIRGYFTRAANITISLDPDQITQNFTFELPMLCTDFNVQCRDSVSQFCHQSDGRCRCKPGYYNPNPDQQRRSDYVVESVGTTLRNFDGDDLSCLPICQNDGDWVTATQSCTCQPGFSGANCEVSDQCQQSQKDLCAFGSNTISSDPISLGPQVANGYVKFVETKCQDSCTCYGKWTESITPSPSDSRSCSTCSLKPISRELYHADSLDMIEKAYLDSAELAPHYSPDRDEKYTQIYQPTVDSVTTPHDLTRQRCYITGTQNKTWEYGQCSQCLCHRGYGGDYCQLHIAYANITYTPGENNKYHYDGMTEILLFDKIVEELSLSMNNFNRDDLFIVQHNTNSHWIEVGFYTGLDFFIRNAELASAANVHQEFEQEKSQLTTEEPSSFSILSQYLSPLSSTFQFQPLANVNTWNQPPITFNSQLPSNLDNLYTQWGQLQGNLPTAPIVHQDSGSFLGEITLPEPIQDPVCFDQGLLGCSGDPPKRASSTALIIGLVVGLLCAALLFLILVLVLRWCKKNERGFWKSHEQQDRDEMSNFVPTTRKGFTGSTAAPSMTVGTLSIMPMAAGAGVEMSNTGGASATSPKSSVQSVNNHTEVKDPTLPPEYKAYKDLKGNIFYINTETMTTSWAHPAASTETGGGGGDYGSGW